MEVVKLSEFTTRKGPFLRDLKAHGKSDKTIATYESHFAILLKFLPDDVRALTSDRLQEYVQFLSTWQGPHTRGEGMSVNSIHGYLSSLRSLCHWLTKKRFLKADPTEDLEDVKRPRKLPRAIPLEWIERIMASDLSARDRAIIMLNFTCGLRRAELVALDFEHVSIEDALLLVRDGKGGEDRALPIPTDTQDALKAWLSLRGATPGPLFYGCRKQRLGQYGIGLVLHNAAIKAGVSHITPHQLRHTFGTEAANAGVNIEAIRQALGHKSLATTQKYLHVTARGMQEAFQRLTDLREKRIVGQSKSLEAATNSP